MRDSPVRGMYLRPGNLYKEFRLLEERAVLSDTGMPLMTYTDTGRVFRGILSEVSTDESSKHLHDWDQSQHSLTHTVVTRGRAVAKKGDMIAGHNKLFYVLLVEDVGFLGITTIYYLEERNDVK